jgi:hypothetical protein
MRPMVVGRPAVNQAREGFQGMAANGRGKTRVFA